MFTNFLLFNGTNENLKDGIFHDKIISIYSKDRINAPVNDDILSEKKYRNKKSRCIMDEFRFLLVGTGNIASTYVKALANIPEAVIAGCVSRSGRRPAGLDETVPVYPSISAASVPFDAVILATPNGCHAAGCLEAARLGKHVFTEVPSAFTVDECWELVETSERTKKHCMQLENCCYGRMELMVANIDICSIFPLLYQEGIIETNTELHAGELETSLMLALAPETVQMDLAADCVPTLPRSYLSYGSIFRASPSGVWGEPSKATAQKACGLGSHHHENILHNLV